MKFYVEVTRGYVTRRVEVEAPHGAAARAFVERELTDGETVGSIVLASMATVAHRHMDPYGS